MYLVPAEGKYFEKYMYQASTCLKQAHFDYPLGACLIQFGL